VAPGGRRQPLFATVGAVAIAYLFTRVRIEKARAAIAINTPDRP
jgi:hypothetical protein